MTSEAASRMQWSFSCPVLNSDDVVGVVINGGSVDVPHQRLHPTVSGSSDPGKYPESRWCRLSDVRLTISDARLTRCCREADEKRCEGGGKRRKADENRREADEKRRKADEK